VASLGHVAVGLVAGRVWTEFRGEQGRDPRNSTSLVRAIIAFRIGIPYAAAWS
jgi:hypothetical protein